MMVSATVSLCIGCFVGIIIGLLLKWLVLSPALNYHEIGFWWIALIREDPPEGMIYQGKCAVPLWKKEE